MTALPPPQWIDTTAALRNLAGELSNYPRLAVDTESNSLHAYREQLCLVQFSTPKADCLVDPLALNDLSPLAPVFSNPKIEKVFHAAEYDLICLKRDFGITVVNLFDTMQAARILGYKQVGLDTMLAEKESIILNKRYQKADWARRPLMPEMLNYARLDTHYLLDLRDRLKVELEQRGRWALACEEFTRLASGNGNGNGKPETPAWQHVKGTQKLTDRQLTILQELCIWRQFKAQKMDRPVFKVIDDQRLAAVAREAPKTAADLTKIGLTTRQVALFGSDLLHAVQRGKEAALIHRPRTVRPKQALIDRLNALSDWRKEVAQGFGVESDIVLPKTWMHAIAEQNPKDLGELAALMPNSPWRLENYGVEILKTIGRETGNAHPL